MRPGGVIDIEVKAACAVGLVERAGDELIRCLRANVSPSTPPSSS
jgi:hypothetical protein